MHIIID